MPFVPDPKRIEVVDEAVAAILRTKTPAERVAMACAANRAVRLLIQTRLTLLHPAWTGEQVQNEVARRMMKQTEFTPRRPIPAHETHYTAEERDR